METEPLKEHRWLNKFIGEWTYESEMKMGPDQPPAKTSGTESVRALGGFWILAEGQGEMPGGTVGTTLMTLGYDAHKKRYVGTWVGSMMPQLWIYDPTSLDEAGKELTLGAEGPAMSMEEGKLQKYRDVIEWKSDDQRVMTSYVLGDDGKWNHFMTTSYKRKR